jgi:hypothetical protein
VGRGLGFQALSRRYPGVIQAWIRGGRRAGASVSRRKSEEDELRFSNECRLGSSFQSSSSPWASSEEGGRKVELFDDNRPGSKSLLKDLG